MKNNNQNARNKIIVWPAKIQCRTDARNIFKSKFPGISLPPTLTGLAHAICDILECLDLRHPKRTKRDSIIKCFIQYHYDDKIIVTDSIREQFECRYKRWHTKKTTNGSKKRNSQKRPINNKYADFYKSKEWNDLRYLVFAKYGARCQCCGRTAKDGVVMHVDHIKPRSKYPELELDENNLQVLCEDCNLGKSNKFEIDHR